MFFTGCWFAPTMTSPFLRPICAAGVPASVLALNIQRGDASIYLLLQ
jgi:hypothetical protein